MEVGVLGAVSRGEDPFTFTQIRSEEEPTTVEQKQQHWEVVTRGAPTSATRNPAVDQDPRG